MFRKTEDRLDDWRHATKFTIQDLIIRASRKVSDRKTATQTGFQKLNFPHFNGEILYYLEFKKHWSNGVFPERKPGF